MSKDVKQLFVMLALVVGFFSVLWIGVIVSSPDIKNRNECYKDGVANLPQGVDQTLLQTQSAAYKKCLSQVR